MSSRGAQLWLLGCDAGGAVVRVAHSSPDAADGLHGRVRQRHTVGSQRQRLHEVDRHAEPTGDDQGDSTTGSRVVEKAPRPCKGGDGGDTDVVPEHLGRSPGSAAAPIEDDVVDTGIEGELHVGFDVVRTELHADRDTAGQLANAVTELSEVVHGVQVGERRWRDGCFPLRDPSNLRDFAVFFEPGR